MLDVQFTTLIILKAIENLMIIGNKVECKSV